MTALGFWLDYEAGDLAAAGGYVGEAGGAQPREEAAELAAEDIGGEIVGVMVIESQERCVDAMGRGFHLLDGSVDR